MGTGLLGLVVRLVHQIASADVPTARFLVGDAAGYMRWAGEIAGGSWWGTEPFYQAPLYPYVLAILFWAFGKGPGIVLGAQAMWGAAGVGLLSWATCRLFGMASGLVAGLMLALYPPTVFFDGIIQKASLGCLLTVTLVALTAKQRRARTASGAAAIGVAGALLVLTRENAAVWMVLLALWLILPARRDLDRRGLLRVAGGFVLGAGVVLIPVGVRNASFGGAWSLSTFQAGPNFYIGNRAGADGRYTPLVRGHETPAFERRDATRLAEQDVGRKLSPRDVSRYWLHRTLSDIGEDPIGWLRLMGRKLLMVWNRYEVADAESPFVYAQHSSVLRMLRTVWHFGVLCPLAAAGIIATWEQRRRLWLYYAMVITMALAVAFFFVLGRYRFPLAPLLIPFAAAGCVEAWHLVRGRRHEQRGVARARVGEPSPPAEQAGMRRWSPARAGASKRLAVMGSVAALVAVAVNVPVHDETRLNAMAMMNAGVALASGGEVAGALPYFEYAVAHHPQSAEAHNNFAMALAVIGDYKAAIEHYETALRLEPTLGGVHFNMAVALERVGRKDEALAHYRQAAAANPADAPARAAIDRLEGELGTADPAGQ